MYVMYYVRFINVTVKNYVMFNINYVMKLRKVSLNYMINYVIYYVRFCAFEM